MAEQWSRITIEIIPVNWRCSICDKQLDTGDRVAILERVDVSVFRPWCLGCLFDQVANCVELRVKFGTTYELHRGSDSSISREKPMEARTLPPLQSIAEESVSIPKAPPVPHLDQRSVVTERPKKLLSKSDLKKMLVPHEALEPFVDQFTGETLYRAPGKKGGADE